MPLDEGRTQFGDHYWFPRLLRRQRTLRSIWWTGSKGAPIGVARATPAAGIFPLIPLKTSDTKAISSLYSWDDGHTNYVSGVHDNRERERES